MRTFRARFSGPCWNCPVRIQPGDEVVYVDDVVIHADCVDVEPTPDREPAICPTCHLQRPCDCT